MENPGLPQLILALVGFVGFAGLVAVTRAGWRRYKVVRGKVVEAWGDLFGREAVRHPNTDEVILEATPGIGTRLTMLERGQTEQGEVLHHLASTQAELGRIHERIDGEREARLELATELHDFIEGENRNRQLELEEQSKMWEAIRAVAEASPAVYRPGEVGP